MNFFFMFVSILVQILLKNLADSSRIMQLPLELKFDPKNINVSNVLHHNKTVVCVINSWSHWLTGDGKFTISDIDGELCTQLVYRTAKINDSTFEIEIKDYYLDETLGWYRKSVALRQSYPHLRVLLSVGGYTEGSFRFSKLAADYEKRSKFVDSVVLTIKKYEFDGLDLAWEYPALLSRGGEVQDIINLPLLVKDLRLALGKNYILSVTAPGDPFFISPGYNIKSMHAYVDQFNVRPFDFAGSWDKIAYHHSPLHDDDAHKSVTDTVNYYIDHRLPREKLVVGVPFYGRTFLLNNPQIDEHDSLYNQSGLGKPTKGGFGGMLLKDNQLLGYHEICQEISHSINGSWKTFWDNKCTVPYARNGEKWVSFDNIESIEAKARYVRNNNLKGVMAWTIDTDDFKGTACSGGGDMDDKIYESVSYPLLRTLNFALTDADKTAEENSNGNESTDRHPKKPHPRRNLPEQEEENKSNFATIISWNLPFLLLCLYFAVNQVN